MDIFGAGNIDNFIEDRRLRSFDRPQKRPQKFSASFRNKYELREFLNLCMYAAKPETDAILVMNFVYPIYRRYHKVFKGGNK